MKTTYYELQIKSVMRRNYWATIQVGKFKSMVKELATCRAYSWRNYRLVRVTTTREVIKG